MAVGVVAGGMATFTVEAFGEGLTYQWFGPGGSLLDKSGKIAGATTATLQIFDVQSNDLGNYLVRVSNIGGSVFSAVATLRISKAILMVALD